MRILFPILLIAACDYGRAPDVVETPEAARAPTTTAAAPEAPPKPEERLRVGRVLESLEAGEYTYAKMDACGDEAWVAGPKTQIEDGAIVEMPQGMAMADFHSPSLDRTFDHLLFVDWFRVGADAPDCAAQKAALSTPQKLHGAPEGSGEKPTPKALSGEVLETMVSGGYRYARLKTCDGEVWVAGQQLPLNVGDHLTSDKGAQMDNFSSQTLKRTFESIRFVSYMAIDPAPFKCK